MLETGTLAPDFTLPNQDGETITLSKLKGQKVVLFFYPKDDTPGCTREGLQFTELNEAFKAANTKVFGVSKDSVDSHKSFCNKHNYSIDLLSDEDKKVIEAYGIWQEKKNYGKTYMGIVRSTYLIDEDGKVQKLWKNVKVDGHAEKVLKEAES